MLIERNNPLATPVNDGISSNNNPYLNGILWGDQKWPKNEISYSFFNKGSIEWSPDGIKVIQAALEEWESVANIEFVLETDNNSDADLKFNLADNSYFDSASGIAGSKIYGKFSPPGESNEGEGFFNFELLNEAEAGLKPGELGFSIILHEIGHGLGLAHPHDDSSGSSTVYSGVTPNEPKDTGLYNLNQGVWTTMSYNPGFNSEGFQATPMAFDIAAVQYLYGANLDNNSKNNVYILPSSDIYKSIWDAGGIDTISALKTKAGVGVGAKIDLRQAPLVEEAEENAGGYISAANGIDGGFTIANGVAIENAQGSLYDDTLVGNELNNNLSGEGGKDYLVGLTGNDVLVGGYGNDTLIGTNPQASSPGSREYDVLTGGGTADIFVLGTEADVFYQGEGYATITDFDQLEGDRITLSGVASDYSLNNTSDGNINISYQQDVIGVIVKPDENISEEGFTFV